MWNFLNTAEEDYQIVIATDVRDVVFQYNPVQWLEDHFIFSRRQIVAASECMKYKDEIWNSQNLDQAFGPFFHKQWKDMEICNVGVIAGEKYHVRDLMLMIFHLSVNRPIPVVDQVVYNVFINQIPWKEHVAVMTNKDGWVANLGATLAAIQSGHGDIAQQYKGKTGEILYQSAYMDEQPIIDDDVVLVEGDDPKLQFCIVHQYDRVNGLKEKIQKKFQ
jgi:hypothetical protein